MTLKSVSQWIASFGLLVATVGCGGGGGGSSTPTNPVPSDPEPQGLSFTLTGTATKGSIALGVVNVYAGGNLTSPVFVGSELTGSDGSYQLTVPPDAGFSGEVVIVEVVGNEEGTSTMVCDLDVVSGCSVGGTNYSFGETVPIPAGFGLRAALVAPPEGQSQEVHINSLTQVVFDMATEVTLDSDSLDDANTQLTRLLDLPATGLPSIEGIDLSSSAARSGATNSEMKVAVLSAGLLAVALQDQADLAEVFNNSTQSLAAAVSAYARDPENSAELADQLAPIQQAASGLARDLNRPEVAADLFAEFALSDSGLLEDLDPAPSPGEGLNGLDQAKLFVDDLRNVRAAFREEELRNDFDPLESALEMAEDIASDATEDALQALFDVISAMADAAEVYNDDETLTSFVAENGIEITITPGVDEINAEFSVSELSLEFLNSGTNLISVSARLAGTSSSGDVLGDEFTFAGELELSATVENSRVTLEVSEGNAIIEALDVVVDSQAASEITARLSATLAQVPADDVSDPVTLEGQITATALDVTYDEDVEDVEGGRATFDTLSVAFSGEVYTASDAIQATISVVADGTDFFLGASNLGTLFEDAIEYTVEGDGKVLNIYIQDLERPDPSIYQSVRAELLSAEEVQALGGLPDIFAAQPATFLGEAIRLQTFDMDGYESTWSEFWDWQLFNNAGVLLFPIELFDFEFSNIVEFYNGPSGTPDSMFTTFENLGVFEWVFTDGPFSLDGGFIDLELFCVGFCDIIEPDGSVVAVFWDTDRPFFQEDRQNVIRGVFNASINTEIIGIGDETGVDMSVSGEKLGLDTFEVSGNLSYAGRSFDLIAVVFDIERLDDIDSLSAVNQDGIVIELTRDEDDFITGSIYRGDEEFATIEEDVGPGDVLLIRYSDGTIESL